MAVEMTEAKSGYWLFIYIKDMSGRVYFSKPTWSEEVEWSFMPENEQGGWIDYGEAEIRAQRLRELIVEQGYEGVVFVVHAIDYVELDRFSALQSDHIESAKKQAVEVEKHYANVDLEEFRNKLDGNPLLKKGLLELFLTEFATEELRQGLEMVEENLDLMKKGGDELEKRRKLIEESNEQLNRPLVKLAVRLTNLFKR